MRRLNVHWLLIGGGLAVTGLVLWFAVTNYRSAGPVARSLLKGISLSLGQAIETVAAHDPTFRGLGDFSSRDVAYFSLLDSSGRIRFHTNPGLIGQEVGDRSYLAVLASGQISDEMVRLGTGEVVFQTQQQLHLPGEVLILRLSLHTWQADQIIQRARTGLILLLTLTVSTWGLALFAMRLQRRDLRRREELARREHLAQLGEMGAVLAHEVRTPLAGIKGFAQLLGERGDERQRGHAARIVAESERLEELVNDLLSYARTEPAGDEPVRVEEALRGAWAVLSAEAAGRGIALEVSGTVSRPALCPPERLRQVFLNLFSNALQVVPSGGLVRVVLNSDQRMAGILVADSGPGFTAESLPRLFDPFYTTRATGSGLGLAICRKIVESCGGTISAANGAGGGAEIRLALPLVRQGG